MDSTIITEHYSPEFCQTHTGLWVDPSFNQVLPEAPPVAGVRFTIDSPVSIEDGRVKLYRVVVAGKVTAGSLRGIIFTLVGKQPAGAEGWLLNDGGNLIVFNRCLIEVQWHRDWGWWSLSGECPDAYQGNPNSHTRIFSL